MQFKVQDTVLYQNDLLITEKATRYVTKHLEDDYSVIYMRGQSVVRSTVTCFGSIWISPQMTKECPGHAQLCASQGLGDPDP